MTDSFLIVGVLRTSDGIRIIDPNKQEHDCASADELYTTIQKLFSDESIPTPTTEAGERRKKEIVEFNDNVDKIGRGIGEYVSSQYGETIGEAVERAAQRGGKGVAGFLRRISRP